MSIYRFGHHDGHLSQRANLIAARRGGWHRNYIDPRSGAKTGWFACLDQGAIDNEVIRRAVLAAIDRHGGIAALAQPQPRMTG